MQDYVAGPRRIGLGLGDLQSRYGSRAEQDETRNDVQGGHHSAPTGNHVVHQHEPTPRGASVLVAVRPVCARGWREGVKAGHEATQSTSTSQEKNTRIYCVQKTKGGYSRSFMVDLLSEIRPITFTLQTSCGCALSRHERDLAAPRRSAFGVRVGDGRETCGRGGRGVRPWQPSAESGAAHQPVAGPS